jgi:hypothetical protein
MIVATACVPHTAMNKIREGRIDQNGPRVRVRKIVRCPATDHIQTLMYLNVIEIEMKDALPKIKQAERGDDSSHEIMTELKIAHLINLILIPHSAS